MIILLVFIGVIFFINTKKDTKKVVPQYVFTYADNQQENYPTVLGAKRFAELVEERTNGRIKILVYSGGELGDETKVFSQLQCGGVDFERVSLGSIADVIPQFNVLQMPYLYKDAEHMWKVLNGDIGQYFMDLCDEYDFKGLSWYDAGARSFYSSEKKITCLEDMKNMNIRVQQSDMAYALVEALGANAVTMQYSQVYSGLEIKDIDGAENNWPSYESTGHYKVAKYYTIDEHTRIPEMQICSMATWNQLSKEDKSIIMDCAKKSALYEQKLWTEREQESKRLVLKSGVEVIELSKEEKEKFQRAVTGVYEQFCSESLDIIERIIEEGNH